MWRGIRRYCNTGSIRNDGPAGRHTNHRYEPIYLSYPGPRRARLVRLSHWEHHRVVRRFTSHAGIPVLNGTGVSARNAQGISGLSELTDDAIIEGLGTPQRNSKAFHVRERGCRLGFEFLVGGL